MNLSSAERPKFECEEFVDQGNSRLSFAESPFDAADDAETEPARSEGLCSDCASRKHCAWRTPEGGVWHCEEYC